MPSRKEWVDMVISIHTPHAGRDWCPSGSYSHKHGISIHTPHAGRDEYRYKPNMVTGISIHTPHAGRDKATKVANLSAIKFQSTRPMRGATE